MERNGNIFWEIGLPACECHADFKPEWLPQLFDLPALLEGSYLAKAESEKSTSRFANETGWPSLDQRAQFMRIRNRCCAKPAQTKRSSGSLFQRQSLTQVAALPPLKPANRAVFMKKASACCCASSAAFWDAKGQSCNQRMLYASQSCLNKSSPVFVLL